MKPSNINPLKHSLIIVHDYKWKDVTNIFVLEKFKKLLYLIKYKNIFSKSKCPNN